MSSASDRDLLRFLWSEDAQGGKAVGRGWAEWRQEKAALMLAAKGGKKEWWRTGGVLQKTCKLQFFGQMFSGIRKFQLECSCLAKHR